VELSGCFRFPRRCGVFRVCVQGTRDAGLKFEAKTIRKSDFRWNEISDAHARPISGEVRTGDFQPASDMAQTG
jgi:hypothetical protein